MLSAVYSCSTLEYTHPVLCRVRVEPFWQVMCRLDQQKLAVIIEHPVTREKQSQLFSKATKDATTPGMQRAKQLVPQNRGRF